MNMKFWETGSQHRMPRKQFWTSKAYVDIPAPNGETMRSKETIHWTIHTFATLGSYPACSSLKAATIEPQSAPCRCPARHRRLWRIPLQNAANPSYDVCEESASDENLPAPRSGQTSRVDADLEMKVLNAWLDSELIALKKSCKAGDPAPNTCIAEVKDALWRAFQASLIP